MTKEKDIVTDILDRVEAAVRIYLQHDQGFEQSLVDAISAQIRAQDGAVRQHWGRSEAYVAARAPGREEAKRQALEEANRSGKPIEAATRWGISRATMYRLLKR